MRRVLMMVVFIVVAMFLIGTVNVGAQVSNSSKNLTNTFKEQNFGYSMSYPDGWTYAYQAPHIVVFSPRKAGNGDATISVWNLNSTKVPGGRYKDTDAVIEGITNQLKVAKDVIVYNPEPYLYEKGLTRLMGKQLKAEYTIQGDKYRQWVVVLPRPTGDIFHVWSYVARVKSYDGNLATAQAILNSWTIKQ